MKITSLSVEGAGRFGSSVHVEGLGDGVNILAAGNEAGKSTLFRCIRTCLFERHGATSKAIHELCSDGVSLPLTVKLGFEQEGHAYVIAKSFIRSPSASLRRDGVEIARGREADERVWEILGVSPGGGRSVDENAFGLLWVGQGEAIERPVPSGGAANTLNGIVHEEVGAFVGGERARRLLQNVESELGEQLTSGGRAKASGPLGKALAQAADLEADLKKARERLQGAESDIAELERYHAERAQLADPSLLAKMRADVEAAESASRQATKALSDLQQAQSAKAQANARQESASQSLARLTDCAGRIDESRRREGALETRLLDLRQEQSEVHERLSQVDALLEDQSARRRDCEGRQRSLRRLLDAVNAAAQETGLRARLDTINSLAISLTPLETEIAANFSTPECLKKLDDLDRELDLLRGRLAAGATHIEIKLTHDGEGTVTVDGRAAASEPLPILRRTEVKVGSLATITATPPAGFGDKETERQRTLEDQRNRLISDAGVRSAPQLREQAERRRRASNERQNLLAQLKALGVKPDAVAEEVERLTRATAKLERSLGEALSLAGVETAPDAQTLTDEIARAENEIQKNQIEAQRLSSRREVESGALQESGQSIGRVEGELAELRRGLSTDLAILPDPDREQLLSEVRSAVESANREQEACAAAVRSLQSGAPSDLEVERLSTRVERLRVSIDTHTGSSNSIELKIAGLEARLMAIGGDGVGEEVAALEEESRLYAREAERLNARVAMLRLLRDVIENCYRNQQEQLNAPLIRHLQPLLNDLFPSAKPELGNDFSLTGLRRESNSVERFERLSDGTKEQVAVLVRLAMGSLICASGRPAPVILDDALVYSDDDRIERMFDALNRAGKQHQVIVLTCRMRAFASLGARQLSIVRDQDREFRDAAA